MQPTLLWSLLLRVPALPALEQMQMRRRRRALLLLAQSLQLA
jgi:hypothetical protein